jgi:Uma2 family endonuclease
MSTVNVHRRRKPRLGAWSNGMLISPEEFDKRTDFDELYVSELIKGVLIVSPPPGESERDPNGELEFLLRSYQWSQPGQPIIDKTLAE